MKIGIALVNDYVEETTDVVGIGFYPESTTDECIKSKAEDIFVDYFRSIADYFASNDSLTTEIVIMSNQDTKKYAGELLGILRIEKEPECEGTPDKIKEVLDQFFQGNGLEKMVKGE
jgi:hypothetical protein